MNLSRARADYDACALAIAVSTCVECGWLGLEIEAASLRLDLMTAEASLERIRGSVAW